MDSRLWSSYTRKLSPLLAVWGARQVVREQDEGGDRGKAFSYMCVVGLSFSSPPPRGSVDSRQVLLSLS